MPIERRRARTTQAANLTPARLVTRSDQQPPPPEGELMFNKKLAGALGAGIFVLGIAASAAPAQAATFTVNNAQQRPRIATQPDQRREPDRGRDQILFDIPGAARTDHARHRPAGRHAAGGDPRLLAAGRLAATPRRRTRRS